MEYKKFTRLAYFLAISIVLGIIESIIPFSGSIPGLKLGLSNIIILGLLYTYGFKEAIYISILRVIVIGILRTGLFSTSFILSLSGALLSIITMYLTKKTKLSIIGVSICGSISHSLGQIFIAAIILKTSQIIYYSPFLIIFSIPTGIIIGIISKQLVQYLKNRL